MPSVPTYNQQVNQAAIGGAKVNTAQPLEAFGGGAAAEGVNKAIQQSVEIVRVEREKADQVAVTGADTAAAQRKHQYFVELQGLKGEKAFGARDELTTKYKSDIDKISEGLATPAQRNTFKSRADAHESDLNFQIDKHVFAEAQQVDKQKTMASIETYGNEAVLKLDDTFGHETALNEQKKTMAAYGARNGTPDEAVKVEIKNMEAKTRSQTIDRFLFNEAPEKAKAYFELHKEQFGLDEQKKIKAAIEGASVDKDAQVKVNQLMASAATQTEARQEIRKMSGENTKLYDETIKRFENEYKANEADKKQRQEGAFQSYFTAVDQDHTTFKTIQKTAGYKSLPADMKNTLANKAQQRSENRAVHTDMATYNYLTALATSDPEKFIEGEFLPKYSDRISESHLKGLVDMQNKLRKGDNSAAVFHRTVDDRILSTGKLKGDTIKKDSYEFYSIKKDIEEKVNAKKANGERVGEKEIQQMIDDRYLEVPSEGGSFLGIDYGKTKKASELEYSDVPKQDKIAIGSFLKSKGQPATERQIMDFYIRHQSIKLEKAKN